MAIATRVKLTYDDLVLFPDDGKRHELIDGEHIMTPARQTNHQSASGNLFALLYSFVRKNKAGRVFSAPFDVVFSDFDVIEPDIVFITHERANTITEDNVRGAPDLAIEILSPSTAEMDRRTKLRLYEKYGVREYWLVSPEAENVQVFVLRDGKYALPSNFSGAQDLHSEILSGFTCKALDVFQV